RVDLHTQRGDVQAVKGLRIGAAPGPDAGLIRLLIEAGIDPERDSVRIGPVPATEGASVSFGVTAARALEEGAIDGFWANGMGAAVAIQRGVGTVVLDVRRGDGPEGARGYTFPALVTTERFIAGSPESVSAAIRAIVRAQAALREDQELATGIGRRIFPPLGAELIADLILRDLPYYDPAISEETVGQLNDFARASGLLSRDVPYDQ